LTAEVPNFEFTQENGVVNVTGSGEMAGVDLALSPTAVVKDDTAEPGLSVDDQGRYVIVTQVGLKLTFTPAPKSPVLLYKAAGCKSGKDKLKMKKHGGVHFSAGKHGHVAAMFSPFVEKAPKGMKEGVTFQGKTGLVVYADGTMQRIMPAMPEPAALDTAVQSLLAALGLQVSLEFNFSIDGTATFTDVLGVEQRIEPEFDVKVPADSTATDTTATEATDTTATDTTDSATTTVEPTLELKDSSTAEITTEDGTQTLNIVPVEETPVTEEVTSTDDTTATDTTAADTTSDTAATDTTAADTTSDTAATDTTAADTTSDTAATDTTAADTTSDTGTTDRTSAYTTRHTGAP
jgi:hypothetical protein